MKDAKIVKKQRRREEKAKRKAEKKAEKKAAKKARKLAEAERVEKERLRSLEEERKAEKLEAERKKAEEEAKKLRRAEKAEKKAAKIKRKEEKKLKKALKKKKKEEEEKKKANLKEKGSKKSELRSKGGERKEKESKHMVNVDAKKTKDAKHEKSKHSESKESKEKHKYSKAMDIDTKKPNDAESKESKKHKDKEHKKSKDKEHKKSKHDDSKKEHKDTESKSAKPTLPVSVPVPVPVTTVKAPIPIRTSNTHSNSISSTNSSSIVVNGGKSIMTPPNSISATPIRKPVAIRTPGSNRPAINPIYTTQSPATTVTASNASDPNNFIVPGVNDTEESKKLAAIFGTKWLLPGRLRDLEEQTGLKYRRGRFSDAELILATKLTNKYCQEQGITLDTFKRVLFEEADLYNKNRFTDFFVSVSQYFGGRPVVAVYDCLHRMYHPGNHRGPWTPEEDRALLQEFQKHGPRWTAIGKELNREPHNCRDRYNLRWKHIDRKVSGPWSPEESKQLYEAVKESIKRSGVISWIWISEDRVRNRSPLQCLTHWKILKNKSKQSLRSATDTATCKTKAPSSQVSAATTSTSTTTTKKVATLNGWKDDEDYLLIHAILTQTGENSPSDESVDWKSLKIPEIPQMRHNHEIFFRRWNQLKSRAEVNDGDLKSQVERVKKYLVNLSKSPAYIFSEDEEEDF